MHPTLVISTLIYLSFQFCDNKMKANYRIRGPKCCRNHSSYWNQFIGELICTITSDQRFSYLLGCIWTACNKIKIINNWVSWHGNHEQYNIIDIYSKNWVNGSTIIIFIFREHPHTHIISNRTVRWYIIFHNNY